jgi:hypothetical protein
VARSHIEYLAEQVGGTDAEGRRPDVRRHPQAMEDAWRRLVQGLLADCTAQERSELAYFLTVGSVNMDYRSMVMDGEVMVTLAGWQALCGLMDFMLLPGLCDWVGTTDELDARLPPPGGFTRGAAGLMKLGM